MRRSAAKTEIAELATREGIRTLSCDHLVVGGLLFKIIVYMLWSMLKYFLFLKSDHWFTFLQWATSSSPEKKQKTSLQASELRKLPKPSVMIGTGIVSKGMTGSYEHLVLVVCDRLKRDASNCCHQPHRRQGQVATAHLDSHFLPPTFFTFQSHYFC